MSKTFRTRVTRLLVLPDGDPAFSEMATSISIDDESAGEFVVVEQHGRTDLGKIVINPEEWPELRAAIDRMISECEGGA